MPFNFVCVRCFLDRRPLGSFLPVAEIIDAQEWLLREDDEDIAEEAAYFSFHLLLGELDAIAG
jgi:hypothetical protein